MHIAAYQVLTEVTIPESETAQHIAQKSIAFMPIVKIGRTHLMDATL